MVASTTRPSRGWGNFQATVAIIFCISTASALVGSSPVDVGQRSLSDNDFAEDTQENHHIHKRATVTLSDNVTFSLTKTGEHENMTNIRLGSRVSFQLHILFPQGTTDMLVELFAPDNDTIVMMLCDVNVNHKGINLVYTGSGEIVMDSQNASTTYFDRAIIDFGNVTNDFTNQNNEDENAFIITWDAVMIQNDDTVDQNEYWVSAGAEYNDENEVWVGQASFTADLTAEPTQFPTPVLNLTGPSSMAIGQTAVFKLDIYLTEPSAGLSVDAFAPLNATDSMSICGMKVLDTGSNYMCGFKPEEHTAVAYPDSNTRGNGRYRMDMGTVTNKGARDSVKSMDDNRITVEFLVHLYEDESYIDDCFWVGAAVEIGSTHIWAGEIKVTATAYAPSSPSLAPTWTVTKEGSGKVSPVSPLLMSLDLNLQQKSWSKYALEILAPFNDSAAVFQLCAVRLVSAGENLACTDPEVPVPIYTSRGSVMFTDRGYVDLGVVTNVGPWGWQPNDTSMADTLRFEFMVKATNHTLAVAGSEHSVTLGLIIGDTRLMIGSYLVEIEAAGDLPNITTEMTPEWNMTWKSGDGNIPVGGSGQFLLSITTKRNTVYAPFDIEALMPNSTGATQVSVCKVKVESVGRNLPCIIPSAINESVYYTSLLEDGFSDRAVINMLSLCNYESVNDTVEDQLVLSVGFMLQPNAGLNNLDTNWLSMGVQFSQYRMWVGQIEFTARTDSFIPSTAPHLSVTTETLPYSVPVGFVAQYQLLIKTYPGTIAYYTINVTVSSPGLSVCSVKVLHVGDNMPCTNASAIEGVYEGDTTRPNIKGSLDLGSVSNCGEDAVVTDNTVDDNTIVIEVMIGLTTDTTVLADSSSHTFGVDVNYDTSTLNPTVPAFTAVHSQAGITVAAMNVTDVQVNVIPVTSSDASDNSTDVVLGQAKQLEMCMWTYPGSLSKLALKMMTPVDTSDVMEVNYIGVSYGGKNVPCASSCKSGVVTYEPRTGSSYMDIGTVDLGYLVNNNFDPVDPDANKVCVRSVVRVLKNDTLSPGSTIAATASVNSNNLEIVVAQTTLTVVDNSTFVDTYQDNATVLNNTIVSVNSTMPNPLCLTPGDVQVFPLMLAIPPEVTSMVDMDIKLELNESACFTYQEMRLVGVGKNLRGFGKDYDLQCFPNSTKGTTQMDTVDCKFGVITNPGISHICEDATDEDDSIYAEVTLQMADCPIAEHDAMLTVSFGLKVAGFIAITNYPVKVCRDGSEEPMFNITAIANSTGSTMYVNFDIRLDNTSKAEIHNSSLIVIPPPYVECPVLESSSGTNEVPVLSGNVTIQLGSVFLTDAINLVLRCNSVSGYTVPESINGFNTVMQYQLYGEIYPRAGSLLTTNEIWSYMNYVNFTATTIKSTGTCTSASLQLDDSAVIFDCQISSSASSVTGFLNGRKGGTGWTPFIRGGKLQGQRYFQVFFANKVLVDRIEVDQKAAARVSQLKMAYSDDGKSFIHGETITLSGAATESKALTNFMAARVVRIYVTNQSPPDKKVLLTFQMFGCEVTTGGPSGETAVCAAVNAMLSTPTPDPNIFYHRSFVAHNGGRVFVCDGVVKQSAVVSRCFTSLDGTEWESMDDRVASIVGLESESNRVYGLHSDGVTYMSSGNNGRTWANTHVDHVNTAKSKLTFVEAMNVPWEDTDALPSGDPPTGLQLGGWGASYDYLKKHDGAAWQSKLKWDCCN